MPLHDYYETLWEGLPEDVEPVHRRLREAFLLDGVASLETQGNGRPRVLDLGCGEGRFAEVLLRNGVDVLAADVAMEPLRRARTRCPGLNTCLLSEDEWPLRDASFDAVWSGETIEHVADTVGWLSQVRRVLRSGGLLLLSTPDNGLLSMLALALRHHALETHFDPRSDHLRFYTRRTLTALLDDFGFNGISVRRTGGLLSTQRLLLARATRARF